MLKRQPITKLVLRALAEVLASTGEAVIEFGHLMAAIQQGYGSAYGRGGWGYVAELKQSAREREVRRALYQLKRSQYLRSRRIGSRLELALTSKGRATTLSQQLQAAPPHSAGEFTVVIFDVPRSENMARRQFRWFLRQSGFIKLQHSVWVSPRRVKAQLVQLVRELKLKPWVNVFEGRGFLVPPRFRM